MKITLAAILIFVVQIFPQESNNSSLLTIKNEIKTGIAGQNENLDYSIPSFQIVEKKNTGLAILYSLLLPGMGELYADAYSSGKYFTIAEAALWGTYLGINLYGNRQQDRYKSFAESYGGVNLSGKDEDYFANISLYENIDDYNDAKALEGNFDEMYNTEKYNWNWSPEERRAYRRLWVSSEEAYNNLRFVVGAMLVNRVISAINAVRMVSKYNDRIENNVGWNVSLGVEKKPTLPTTLKVNFVATF